MSGEGKPITFMTKDTTRIEYPHDDALVIEAMIGNYNIQRILIDTGSSADILYATAYDQMKLGREAIENGSTKLIGFTGHQVFTLEIKELPFIVGEHPCEAILSVKFLILEGESSHNAIIGWATLNRLRTLVSTYHLKMKFPTKAGIGEVKGDQEHARKCYLSDT